MPMPAKGTRAAALPTQIRHALKRAALFGALAFGLAFPILYFRTEQDLDNRLVLESRPWLVAAIVALAAAAAFLKNLGGTARVFEQTGAHALRERLGAVAAVLLHGRLAPVAARTSQLGPILLLAFPFLAVALAGPSGAIKWIDNFGIQILIYILLGWGLNIVVGLAGLLDLGYVAFYAVGAYSSALLAKTFGLSFWLALPLAGILAAFWGLLIGLPVLRLRGDYLAIVTLAFAEIVRLVLINWVPVTGGYAGISRIPGPTIFGLPLTSGPEGLAATLGLPPSPLYRLFFLFYLVLALALFTHWVTVRLRALPIGRAWEAMREDEIACRSLGINTVTTKLSAFATGAFFGGLAGAFFAARQGFISPESFVFMESAVIVAIVVLGGLGSQVGVAIAAIAMIGGTELLRELAVLKALFGADFDPEQYRMLLFGLAMVALMVWRPRGLIATRAPSIRLRAQARPAPRPAAE
jgi:branched-chain amino acid transport system permease protein